MKKYLLLLLLLLMKDATAQNSSWRKHADQAFEKKDYATSAYYYSKLLDEEKSPLGEKVPYFSAKQRRNSGEHNQIAYRLAESYRLSNNYLQAESWYRKVLESDEGSYPLIRLWYGLCLRSNNELDAALAQLQLFCSTNATGKADLAAGEKELKNCQFALEQSQAKVRATALKLEGSFSTEENDFALRISKGKYWFTGTSDRSAKANFNQIFVSDKDSLSKDAAIDFGISSPDSILNFGTPSLSSSGEIMYLTLWHKEAGKTVAAIYRSRLEQGSWSVPQKLNSFVNASGFNAMQPFVTLDGKQMFFVSNRRGGMGGYDIWKSKLDAHGTPLNAVNLGQVINTPDDESSPFYSEQKSKLVFSSKGFPGMGNFDLYESFFDGDTGWTQPRNLGAPYNSTKDDLYYHEDDVEVDVAYLSSDRDSECCLNLFSVKAHKLERVSTLFDGQVKDCATGLGLAGVKVALNDLLSKKTDTLLTNERGEYAFQMGLKKHYELRLEKKNYFSKLISLPAAEKFLTDTLEHVACLQMFVVDKPIVIENILYDFNKAVLKPASLVVLDELVGLLTDNPNIEIELSAHTDSIGPDWYNNKLSQQRAQACVDYIISKGLAESRIYAKGYGESRPVQPNSLQGGLDNAEGRRLNRRTEFKVIRLK